MGLKRKRQAPDTRFRWDDPELPAWCNTKNPNGHHADAVQEFVKDRFLTHPQPLWHQDKSYNWRKQSKLNTNGEQT